MIDHRSTLTSDDARIQVRASIVAASNPRVRTRQCREAQRAAVAHMDGTWMNQMWWSMWIPRSSLGALVNIWG